MPLGNAQGFSSLFPDCCSGRDSVSLVFQGLGLLTSGVQSGHVVGRQRGSGPMDEGGERYLKTSVPW